MRTISTIKGGDSGVGVGVGVGVGGGGGGGGGGVGSGENLSSFRSTYVTMTIIEETATTDNAKTPNQNGVISN